MRNPILLTAVVSLSLAAPIARAEPWDLVPTKGNGVLMETRVPVPAYHSVVVKTSVDLEISEGPSEGATAFVDSNLADRLRFEVDQGVLTISMAGNSLNLHPKARILLRTPTLKSIRNEGSSEVVVKRRKQRVDALELRGTGSGSLDWEGGDADVVTIDQRGSGDFKVRSRARRAEVQTHGSGDLELALDVRGEMRFEQKGSGDIELSGDLDVLTGKSSGSGGLTLQGNARTLSIKLGGSGDLDAADLTAREVSIETSGSGDARVSVRNGPLSAKAHGSGDITWSGTATKVEAQAKGSGKVTQVDG